jgi:hypothetical protein
VGERAVLSEGGGDRGDAVGVEAGAAQVEGGEDSVGSDELGHFLSTLQAGRKDGGGGGWVGVDTSGCRIGGGADGWVLSRCRRHQV